MAIAAALEVWPSLRWNAEALGMDAAALDHLDGDAAPGEDGGSTNDWLLRKIEALASVSQQRNGPDEMLGCDAVLLARLLLEE